MLKKDFRLTKKEDFDRVFRSGKPLFFEEIACRFVKNELSHLRIGFSFSKKHLPLAVERNRLRRIIVTAFLAHKNEWPSSVDIIFFSLKKLKKAEYKPIQAIVVRALKQMCQVQ